MMRAQQWLLLATVAMVLWGCGYTCPNGNPVGVYGCIVRCSDLPRDAGYVCYRYGDDIPPINAVTDSDFADGRDESLTDVTDVRVMDRADGGAASDATMVVVDPALDAPRAVAPLSTSTVTSQRPTLRWVNGPAFDGAVVELSRTRDFATVVHRLPVTGDRARLASALSAGVWFWRLRGRDSARNAEGMATSPVWWFRVGARSADGDRDRSWGTELDLNGDGYADLAVGSPYADSNRGRVDVYYGGPMGIGTVPSVTLRGGAAGDRFGFSVASAGDVNGDGYADLVVGASGASPGGRMSAGTASVFHGSASGVAATPARVLEGAAAFDRLGEAVASAGDVNGDGYADLVVGAPGASPGGRMSAGTASVFHGSASGVSVMPARVLEGAAAFDRLGESVASAGDVNGDGYADIMVGAPGASPGGRMEAGTASVFHGSASGVSVMPARVLEGATAGDQFGVSVASAGDVNGDGYADLVVGAMFSSIGGTGVGRASVFYGSGSGVSVMPARVLEVAAMGYRLALRVASAGDVNGDGYADLVLGARGAGAAGSMEAERARVFHGSASGVAAMPARVLEGATVGDGFGSSVASAGDVNGDGFADLVVGAPNASPGGRGAAGTASVFHGSSSGVSAMPARVLEGAAVGDGFGSSVASVGDVNGASPTRAPRHHQAIASRRHFVCKKHRMKATVSVTHARR